MVYQSKEETGASETREIQETAKRDLECIIHSSAGHGTGGQREARVRACVRACCCSADRPLLLSAHVHPSPSILSISCVLKLALSRPCLVLSRLVYRTTSFSSSFVPRLSSSMCLIILSRGLPSTSQPHLMSSSSAFQFKSPVPVPIQFQ
ncbi:unnamed protein product [Periconia digitata]|uniref:Uncharacterized protein n=1 Tax=Periconia digitata TaxID=1303443 RepID=A0A9W4XWD0_9PLEO|nr:unnamed protein product [Periconia digitata]